MKYIIKESQLHRGVLKYLDAKYGTPKEDTERYKEGLYFGDDESPVLIIINGLYKLNRAILFDIRNFWDINKTEELFDIYIDWLKSHGIDVDLNNVSLFK